MSNKPTEVDATPATKALLDRVRASRAPHDDHLAVDLVRAYDRLRDEVISPVLTATKFVAPMAFAASVFYAPAFVGLASASVVGGVIAFLRSSRRAEEVRQFSRHAQVGSARMLSRSDDVLALEIAGELTARTTQGWPHGAIDLEDIVTLYAPHSTVVLCVGPRGKFVLGEIEHRPLPRATLRK